MALSRSTSDIVQLLQDAALKEDPALLKHISRFSTPNHDFSPSTVGGGLDKIHGSGTTLKGYVISGFNATHASTNIVCPVTGAKFEPDKNGYAKFLHLGTTRVWNPDGSINEDRWRKFADFVTAGQAESEEKIVPMSKLKEYLTKCYNEDPEESNTGRNTNRWFSSKRIQGGAAVKGWDEVYDRLTCGWLKHEGKPDEPYITLKLVREFFEDSDKAFAKAEDKTLPVMKPSC